MSSPRPSNECLYDFSRKLLTLIPSILMVITYYTLFLLLFDSMIEARVDSSASYRKKMGKPFLITSD